MPVNIIPFFSSLAQNEWKTQVSKQFMESNARVITAEVFLNPEENDKRPLREQHNYLFVGTGGTENNIAQFILKAKLQLPVILLSYNENNSLPAAMETRAYLEQNNIATRIIHAPLDQLTVLIKEWGEFETIENKLRTSRIGIIGAPSSWLIASEIDSSAVQQQWGINIEEYRMRELLNRMPDHISEEFQPILARFQNQAFSAEISDQELNKAGIVAQTLLEFIQKHQLDVFTLECFTLLEQTNISGCYALSHLNNQLGITAGCEGDIPTTFTMMLAKLLTKQPVFMANVIDVDLATNSVIFAHCTAPTSLLERYELTTHFESGKSLAIRGKFKQQDVTIAKVFGKDLSEYWVSSGVLTENLANKQGCRTQIRVTLTKPVNYFLEGALANHHVIVLGNYSRKLQEFFSFVFSH